MFDRTLRVALDAIREFALRSDGLTTWASWFTTADALFTDPHPVAPYYADLMPEDASLERRRLAAAAIQGWVFGGAGSWNDIVLPDARAREEYEQVSAALYRALPMALAAAVNGV